MHARFEKAVAQLDPLFRSLLAAKRYKPLSLPPRIPQSGIYLFSEGRRPLYVGRSTRIRKRLGNHCRPGATHKMAAFAFGLARGI